MLSIANPTIPSERERERESRGGSFEVHYMWGVKMLWSVVAFLYD
jgi:hypothetical protein